LKKTIKQYCYNINSEDLKELNKIAFNYMKAKNYFYSRYSGIKTYNLLFNIKNIIRNDLTKDINIRLINFNLPARYWKICLEECIGAIKSCWTNTLNKVKVNVKNNNTLSDNEKHYIFYILKWHELLYNVLNNIDFNIPEKVKFNNIDYNKLNNYIKRQVRKHKFNTPHTTINNRFFIDTMMYLYKNNNIRIQSSIKNERIVLKTNTNQVFNKILNIIIDNNNKSIKICCPIDIKQKENDNNNIIGIDKNYENVIASSNDNIYGDDINKLYNNYTDLVNINGKKKTKLRLLRNKFEINNPVKYNNIINNNLGNKKHLKNICKVKEQFKSLINNSLNEFIENEKPKTIIVEKLDFNGKKKKFKKKINGNKSLKFNKNRLNKKVKNKLSSWCKGYINERIIYKSYINNIDIKYINAAYTSQICSNCGFFIGERSATNEFYCPHCDKGLNVHYNSAMNILNRFNENNITLYTKYTDVKKILLDRNKQMLELKTGTSKTQDNDVSNNIVQSESELLNNNSNGVI